jgi:hypothetical protein
MLETGNLGLSRRRQSLEDRLEQLVKRQPHNLGHSVGKPEPDQLILQAGSRPVRRPATGEGLGLIV